MSDIQLQDICELAREAGAILREGYWLTHQVSSKGHSDDPVTETDRKSEDFVLGRLAEMAPGHTIVTEESGMHSGDLEHAWYIVGPDGTMNFSHRIPFFCISIGYAVNGVMRMGVVYDPMRDECFSAEKGKGAFLNGSAIRVSPQKDPSNALLTTGFIQKAYEMGMDNFGMFQHMMFRTAGVRRGGCAALELCYVGSGRLDGFWDLYLRPWDVAAGFLIIREAGGIVTTLSGDPDPFREPYEFLASNPDLHPALLKELQAGKAAKR